MKRFLIFFAMIELGCASGHCFSAPGHEAIALAAFQMLKGTPAEAKVKAILGDESMADASVWLDRVRENYRFPNASDNQEANQFKRDFPGSENWHFCNFIVGSSRYDFGSKYASSEDVVHALENAIGVLEGGPSKMTKRQALRTVIHLAGDIHQPLHCVTGFYDLTKMDHPVLLTDVLDPKTAPEDRGGNQLYYTASEELHAFWDLRLPESIAQDVNTLASKLLGARQQPATEGDYDHWPEAWAGDSMKAGHAAYDGIVFKSAAYVENPRHLGQQMLKILIALPGGEKGYRMSQQSLAQQQMSRAALRLAQLLTKIDFK
jgi:hypothetical protein